MMQSTSQESMMRSAAASGTPRAIPWAAAIGVALLGDWLLYAALPGINGSICVLAAVAAFIASERSAGKPLLAASAVNLLLAVVLAGGLALTTQPFIQALILLSLAMLAGILVLLSDGLAPARLGIAALCTAPLRAAVKGLYACAEQLRSALGLARAERSLPLIRGGLLALPVGLVFFLLLSAADRTMALWRDDAWKALVALAFVPRILFFVLLMTVALGGCAIAARPVHTPGAVPSSTPPRLPGGVLRDVERLLILGTVAAVFALFLVLQVSYLFGNPGGRAGSGLSYAGAVHQGFGQLTAAAALCLLLTLALDRFALRGKREVRVQALTLFLLAEAGLLLVSACLRLLDYEAAYGYTLQRLYVRAHTSVTAVALALLAWEVCAGLDAGRLFRRLGLTAALAIAIFAYWNHAAWIVAQDFTRYQRTGSIDIDYLALELGDDAIPELIRDLPVLREPQAAALRARLEALRLAHANTAQGRWFEWNLRRVAAVRALSALPPQPAGIASH